MFSKPEDNFRGTSSHTCMCMGNCPFSVSGLKAIWYELAGTWHQKSFSPKLPYTGHFICTSLNKKPWPCYASFFKALLALSIYLALIVILSALILCRGYKGSYLLSVHDCKTRLSTRGCPTLTARLVTCWLVNSSYKEIVSRTYTFNGLFYTYLMHRTNGDFPLIMVRNTNNKPYIKFSLCYQCSLINPRWNKVIYLSSETSFSWENSGIWTIP